MSHHTGTGSTDPCCWVSAVLRRAYPRTAGVTLAALEVLAGQETFTAAQTAYLMQLMLLLGADARSAADAAELQASCAARFQPVPTREARIALRMEQMAEQHEIAWLRRTGSPPPAAWEGGSPEEALERYGWDADRDQPELGPSAARWSPGVGVPTVQTRAGLAWRNER